MKGADGTPQAVQITTGDTNGSMTEVLSGDLKPGAEVITGQLASSKDGTSGGSRRSGGGQRGGGASKGGGGGQ